jgi:hypothetical protein
MRRIHGQNSYGILANHQNQEESFRTQDAAIEPYLDNPLLEPMSPYESKVRSIILGALLTAINDQHGFALGK